MKWPADCAGLAMIAFRNLTIYARIENPRAFCFPNDAD
jgi:hypothetical protein